MISLELWWWPKRPTRVPTAWTAGLLAGLGAALFAISALLLKTGAVGWDVSLFQVLNEVPPTLASVLTPLSHLFLPAGIIAVVTLAVGYVVARNRSVLPVAAGAAATATAWVLSHVAKAIADRPRPYEVVASAVLRQQPAHGTSFPSTHTAVTLAAVIALVPFLPHAPAAVAIAYAVLMGWSRVYLGVHYPLDVLGGAGIGMAVGGVTLLALGVLLHRAGSLANGRNAAGAQVPGPAPEDGYMAGMPPPPAQMTTAPQLSSQVIGSISRMRRNWGDHAPNAIDNPADGHPPYRVPGRAAGRRSCLRGWGCGAGW